MHRFAYNAARQRGVVASGTLFFLGLRHNTAALGQGASRLRDRERPPRHTRDRGGHLVRHPLPSTSQPFGVGLIFCY